MRKKGLILVHSSRLFSLVQILMMWFLGGLLISGLLFAGSNDTLKILAGGDVMLGSWVEKVIEENGYDYPFRRLISVIDDAQIVFVNLEAPFGSSDSAYEKTYTFHVSPDLVEVLVAGKINVVSLANNHILDFGLADLKETFKTLDRYNIQFSGAGLNISDARKPAIFEVNDIKIALVSYSLTFPEEFWATDTTAGTCFPYHTFFYDDLTRFKRQNDLVLVSFHWGAELMNSPKDYQIELAHNAIDAGADLILGHHPHVVQGIEIYKGKIIVYSLGNYIFGSYSENARDSMLLKFFCVTDGIERCKIYPISVYNKEVEFQPYLLKDSDKVSFFQELQQLSLELNSQKIVISEAGWVNLK